MTRFSAAKILPFNPDDVLVDCAFTSRSAQVNVRTGPIDNTVNAEVELHMEDDLSPRVEHGVNLQWSMYRFTDDAKGECKRIPLHQGAHQSISFAVDEIEAFATALYQAVQLAKKQGYLKS